MQILQYFFLNETNQHCEMVKHIALLLGKLRTKNEMED